MGVGDVNGDGRMDMMAKEGWWEQPSSLGGDPEWAFHPVAFSPGGGAQMYAYDVDGDGDNDVITSLAAHGYGLAWYEHIPTPEGITFNAHTVMNKEDHENRYGVHFSQLHAIDLIDMNGDGLKDIVTGKRFWAHGPNGDAEPNAPAVLYWFELTRSKEGVDFVPHLIDEDSGSAPRSWPRTSIRTVIRKSWSATRRGLSFTDMALKRSIVMPGSRLSRRPFTDLTGQPSIEM